MNTKKQLGHEPIRKPQCVVRKENYEITSAINKYNSYKTYFKSSVYNITVHVHNKIHFRIITRTPVNQLNTRRIYKVLTAVRESTCKTFSATKYIINVYYYHIYHTKTQT